MQQPFSAEQKKKKKKGKITWKADVCWALLRSGASEWVPSRSCGGDPDVRRLPHPPPAQRCLKQGRKKGFSRGE